MDGDPIEIGVLGCLLTRRLQVNVHLVIGQE